MAVFLWPVRVYYEDTDSGGVVYYANYLKFMERARTEWLRNLGFEQDVLLRDHGIIYAVRSVQLEYLLPARFNERLTVSAQVVGYGGASIRFAQEVRRDDDLLCRGEVRIVSLDGASFRPRPAPEAVTKLLQNMMDDT